ncbi:hypothetical protein [Nocardioides limicola]|uniref:hypothetical protein n=1 Tax=Nocardioides limicola TaxID=2803368 RepID=UPI00193B9D8C|nr:hypothetical protein [Nocardioides sp. DJM-14]
MTNSLTRVLLIVVAALVVFWGAYALGQTVAGDSEAPDASASPSPEHGVHEDDPHAPESADVAGLNASDGGYTMALLEEDHPAGQEVSVAFRIVGPDGSPVTEYDVVHERPLHLIVVRRDLTGFQHVHPTLVDDTWTTELDLTPGAWRVFADFRPSGDQPRVLGVDLTVPGSADDPATPADASVAEVDGYTVALAGDLAAGADAELTVTVTRDDAPVALQPYLGAHGHLVVLRAEDLGYLHVHADDAAADRGELTFHVGVPSTGDYQLFLDFQVDGRVHTAAMAVGVTEVADEEDDHGH